MAGRKAGFRHSEKTREKIQTTQLVNRLQGFALGQEDPKTGEPIKMSPAQVNAASRLINKRLPDLNMSEVLNLNEDVQDPKELMERLDKMLGEGSAARLFPDFANKLN